jgi:hypothetical protein
MTDFTMNLRFFLSALGIVVLASGVALSAAAAHEIWVDWHGRPENHDAPFSMNAIPLGVLGDSDSQSYHNDFSEPTRFGRYRDVTFQWTEVLSRLRGNQLDLGVWGVRGTRRSLAMLMDVLGLRGRHPRKEDFLYNLAFGGAGCDSLTGYTGRQAPRLLAEMNRDPVRWRRGVVVIRIGINDMSDKKVVAAAARDPADPIIRARADACIARIRASIAMIQDRHPMTRFVLVGLLNNADDPPEFGRWRSGPSYRNIRAGLDVFDRELRKLAASDRRLAFFDDRAWFESHWGTRAADGTPNYKTVYIGPERFPVTLTQGDHPSNAVTQDLHAGVVWTTLWAQSLVALLDSTFDMKIPPITDSEVARALRPGLERPK